MPTPQLPTAKICKGRVPILESNVPASWWSQIFDAVYLKTDGDVVEDPEVTRSEIDMLESYPYLANIFRHGNKASTSSPCRILDLCCGQGRHVLELARRYPDLVLYGHDQSQYLIDLAMDRARSSGVTCTFTVGDCRNIPYPAHSFDMILIMGNSFGYFSSTASDLQVLRQCHRVAKPGAYIVMDLTDGKFLKHNFVPRTWEWIDDACFVCRERQLTKDGKSLVSREVITEVATGVVRDQFYSERLYDQDELDLLLEMALLTPARNLHLRSRPAACSSSAASPLGPSPPQVPPGTQFQADSPVTSAKDLSKRQEDLGMMGHRMLVIAYKDMHSTRQSAAFDAEPYPLYRDHVPAWNIHAVPKKSYSIDSGISSSFDLSNPGEHAPHSATSNTWTRPVPAPNIRHLILILGDPRVPCHGKLNNAWNKEDLETQSKLINVLSSDWPSKQSLTVLDNHATLITHLTNMVSNKDRSDHGLLVFNLCDEGYSNDALKELHIPSLLDMLGLPYTGATPHSLGVCFDKAMVNAQARALGIPTPQEAYYLGSLSTQPPLSEMSAEALDTLIQRAGVQYPAFIKPMRGDNSLGITSRSVVSCAEDMHAYMRELADLGLSDVVVQEYLEGAEFSVGVIGNPASGYMYLPILQVDYSAVVRQNLPPILGYESKWDPESPYWTDVQFVQAQLSGPVERVLHQRCAVLFERFQCRDYARFDFRCSQFDVSDAPDEIKLLEVNPNPGWCWDGKLAKMAAIAGYSYRDMAMLILHACVARINLSR